MLNPNLFLEEVEKANQAERVFSTLLNFNKDKNKSIKTDSLEETLGEDKNLFPKEEILNIAGQLSLSEEKNIFMINESSNNDLKNTFTNLKDNFYKIHSSLFSFPKDLLEKGVSVSILNILTPNILKKDFSEKVLFINTEELRSDIALMRNFGNINIFVPADIHEAEYLLRVSERGFFRHKNNLSYFRINDSLSPEIFSNSHFMRDNTLKEYTGMPDLVFISKNLDSAFSVAIISCGPILYSALLAAKELENRNYKVSVINMSLISSNSEYINQKIKSFIQNFANNNKNILALEEHSKVGGLGSFLAETLTESRNANPVKLERMGLEDDLSVENIIAKCEEISGF